MSPAVRATIAEALAILLGALAINAYLVHRDHAQAALDALCEAQPTAQECQK